MKLGSAAFIALSSCLVGMRIGRAGMKRKFKEDMSDAMPLFSNALGKSVSKAIKEELTEDEVYDLIEEDFKFLTLVTRVNFKTVIEDEEEEKNDE